MNPKQYAIYNRDEMKCQHPLGQIRIADDNTGAYCRKCCDWISVTDVAISVQLAEQTARIAELEAGLEPLAAIAPICDEMKQDISQDGIWHGTLRGGMKVKLTFQHALNARALLANKAQS